MLHRIFLLHVEDPLKSAVFYEKLLRAKPVDASPGFVKFKRKEPAHMDFGYTCTVADPDGQRARVFAAP
jgi:hypothetical protein